MITKKFFDVIYPKFERGITIIIAMALMVVLAYTTFAFLVSLYMVIIDFDVFTEMRVISDENKTLQETIGRLQGGVFSIFGGFLLILLGIELIGTLKSFAEKNHIKIESIIAISIIATSRHLITLDFHHAEAGTLFGAGFIILSLMLGYYLLKTKQHPHSSKEDEESKSV